MTKISYIHRLFTVIALSMMIMLTAALIEYAFDSTTIIDLFLHSPIFNIILFVVLWFAAPSFLKLTKIDAEKNIRPHTILILGGGLIIILG